MRKARATFALSRPPGHHAGLGLPTLFVMEGGYAVEEIGANVAHVLRGFWDVAG